MKKKLAQDEIRTRHLSITTRLETVPQNAWDGFSYVVTERSRVRTPVEATLFFHVRKIASSSYCAPFQKVFFA